MPTNADRFPATWQDIDNVRNIPNGRYVITEHGQEYSFQVWTVQTGSLVDQQIVKYRFPGTSSHKGFATVMTDGTLKLWRSFIAAQNSIWFELAKDLLESIACRAWSTCNALILGTLTAHGVVTNERESMVVTYSRTCLRCNVRLSNHDSRWCSAHQNCVSELRSTIANDERAQHYESQRARRRSYHSVDMVTGEAVPVVAETHSPLIAALDEAGLVAADLPSALRRQPRLVARQSNTLPSSSERSRRLLTPSSPPPPSASSHLVSENGTGLIR